MDIEGYKIHRKIGKGAMASVFLADQESLGRQVALKVLAPAFAGQRGFTERFLREGRIVAYLEHPQIVNVYDLGSHRYHYYLAMEFLCGGTLEQKIKSGLSIAKSVQIIKNISQALRYAHDHGVIHRDIKSQNIMFRNDDMPVLTDFGIARLMDDDPQLTIPGHTMGSPLYMSPEQICGRKIDARADLYSVGVLLYKMLTNKLPYQSDKILTLALMHKTAPLPFLPKDLSLFQPVLNRLLAKEPDQRYANAQELIEALVQLESENAYLRLSSAQERHRTQLTGHLSSARQVSVFTGGQFSHPNINSQPLGGDLGQTTHAEIDAHDWSYEKNQGRGNDLSHLTTSKPMGKIGFVVGGALSVLVAGIIAIHFYSQPDVGLSQSSSALLLDTTRETVQVHDPAAVTQPAVNQKIEDLMAKAKRQLANYSLTLPAGNNCYETYQQILSLEPSGQKAESILIRIGNAYHDLASAAEAKGNLHQSLAHVGKGLALRPKDSALLAMQDDLRTKLAEQDRVVQERAMRIERQKIKRAAEWVSMENRLKVERQLEARRRQEAEREKIEQPIVEPEEIKPQKMKPEPTKSTVEPSDSRKRLFGTF